MRGIILAGGNGTRLYPTTLAISKQLIPVYNKPMIYYPLSTLMLAGVKDILLITNPEDTGYFHRLLGDGSEFGISLNYAVQTEPNGIPEALTIGKHFAGQENIFLVLGDNIVFGTGLTPLLKNAKDNHNGCSIFSYAVKDPKRYGIVELTKDNRVKSIVEKPGNPKSNLAVTGHYMLSNEAINLAKDLKKSARGETEIVDLLLIYMKENSLNHNQFSRGFAWFDCGTHVSLLEASSFVETIESRQGYMVACLEEIAYHNGWLSSIDIERAANSKYRRTDYGDYLLNLLGNNR